MNKFLKRTAKTLIAAGLLASSAIPAWAGDKELKEQFPSFIQDAMVELGLESGLSIAVVKGDEIVYLGTFGYADIQQDLKVTESTSFYIASSTKSFTGLAALILAEKGKLDLDKNLAAYFPEVNFDPKLNADQITVRHLLAHTHGLENSPIVTATAYTGNHTPEKLLEMLNHTTANEKAPMGTYGYSNLGYNIFSMILEREFGKAWQDILAEEVFNPAGMTRTSSYMSDGKKDGWQIARPYGYAAETPRKALYLSKKDNTMHAAGGMIATAPDLARFVQAQLNKGQIDGEQVFPEHLIAEAHKSLATFEEKRSHYMRTGYGMGWVLGTFEGETLISHFGGFAGAHSHVSMLPDHGLGLIVLANEGRASQGLAALIAGYVYDTMRDKEGVDTQRRTELEALVGRANGFKARVAQNQEDRASRTWSLSHAFKTYAGTYSNALYGTISIDHIGPEELKVSLGNMYAVATPYTEQDSIRLEMVPGTGTVIRFVVDENGTTALTYDGAVYSRD